VCTDKVLLERLFRNLIDNAIKYTNAGSVQIDVTREAGHCVVRIRDSGIGVEEEKQAQIFEEFFQVGNPERDRNQGLGLGLSIVSRIAQILDVDIRFNSEPGVGSEFQLTMPAVNQSQAELSSHAYSLREVAGTQVLLVEDDAGVRFATETFLNEAGCIVTSVAGTNEALSQISHDSRPDVVIADIRLPNGDSGIEAISRLRERLPDLAAILVTGESSEHRLAQARDLGVALLSKPVEQELLINEISSLVSASRSQV
jgi:CheY-like chemotaxis protein